MATLQPVPVFQFEVRAGDGTPTKFVSLLAPEQVNQRGGLRAEAILGRLKDRAQPLSPDNFLHNEDFLRFLHGVVGRHAALCPNLMLEAERVKNGMVYVMDGRSPVRSGKPADEDVLGAITIVKGRVTEYKPFAAYRAYTANGFILIDPWLHAMLVNELLGLDVARHEVRQAPPAG